MDLSHRHDPAEAHPRRTSGTFFAAASERRQQQRPTRIVEDADGVQWQVTERPAPALADAPRPCCLIAMSQNIARRLWEYPADWLTCPIEELLAAIDRRWQPGPNQN